MSSVRLVSLDTLEETAPESNELTAQAPATEVVDPKLSALVRYEVTEEQIRAKGAEYARCEFTTPALYKEGAKALAVLRKTRTGIEARRKELKADSLKFGRMVDSVAKQLTSVVSEFEDPLLEKKRLVDEAEAKARAEAEEAEKRAAEEKARLEREEIEARIRAEREAAEAKLQAERDALAAERRQLEEARAAQAKAEAEQKAQRDALEAEQARVQRERLQLETERRIVGLTARKQAAEQSVRERTATLRDLESQSEQAHRAIAEHRTARSDLDMEITYRRNCIDGLLSKSRPDVVTIRVESAKANVVAIDLYNELINLRETDVSAKRIKALRAALESIAKHSIGAAAGVAQRALEDDDAILASVSVERLEELDVEASEARRRAGKLEQDLAEAEQLCADLDQLPEMEKALTELTREAERLRKMEFPAPPAESEIENGRLLKNQALAELEAVATELAKAKIAVG